MGENPFLAATKIGEACVEPFHFPFFPTLTCPCPCPCPYPFPFPIFIFIS
jgi:hypothetical protein